MQQTTINRSVTGWRPGFLALLALACSQLVLAGHQLEHDAAAAGDTCATCVQLEAQDDAAVEPALAAARCGDLTHADARAAQSPALRRLPAYSTRAPPRPQIPAHH